jgi:protein-histidine N-methyltransferase
MSQPFSFGFSGDDIEEDGNGGDILMAPENSAGGQLDMPAQTKAQNHKAGDLVRQIFS